MLSISTADMLLPEQLSHPALMTDFPISVYTPIDMRSNVSQTTSASWLSDWLTIHPDIYTCIYHCAADRIARDTC